MLIPARQPSSLTAKESSGVGLAESKMYTFIPFAASTSADSCAKSAELFLVSYAMAQAPPPFALI